MTRIAGAVVSLASVVLLIACDDAAGVTPAPSATATPADDSAVRETVYSGLAKSRGALALSGGVTAYADAGLTQIERIEFEIVLTATAAPLDVSPGSMPITYIDGVTLVDEVAYDLEVTGGGTLLEPGGSARISLDLTGAGIAVGAGDTFTLEVRPPNGSFLVLQRQTPPALAPIVQLN